MMIATAYRKHCIYIFLGFFSLLFPFFSSFLFLLIFLGGALFFSRIRPDSRIFSIFAHESDYKAGKLKGLTQLFLIMGVLLLVSIIMKSEKLPLFIIGGAFAIATFGSGIADIANIQNQENTRRNIKTHSVK
ncbi:MAG TPA: hypothetical protein VIO11_09665, partial [Candidatus Methanoperedens sp.]